GRFVDEIQFHIGTKKQAALGLRRAAPPVDLALVARAQRLGIPEEALDSLAATYEEGSLRSGLEALERRMATAYPEPLRDPQRYLKALLANAERLDLQDPSEHENTAAAQHAGVREQQSARRQRWQTEWTRRANDRAVQALQALSPEAQHELQEQLLASLQAREAHPSIIKRLTTSGWHHPMVRHEMIRFFADATFGPGWDKPTAEQLLEVAAELGGEE
ncbi:MAG: hypothetical protein REU00_05795, partial [Pseudomonadota bacterium]|nr:hypothetical protein [Pseudomonadota bacterium]